jgi:hypothetical protein
MGKISLARRLGLPNTRAWWISGWGASRMTEKPWTPADDAQLQALTLANASRFAIATELDRSVSAVKKRTQFFRRAAKKSASEWYALVMMIAGLSVVWGGVLWLAATSLWG